MHKNVLLTFILLAALQVQIISPSQAACNGNPAFCDKKYSDVTQIRVHNATSIDPEDNMVANQNKPLPEQLKDGMRVFKLPIHLRGNQAWVTHTLSVREYRDQVNKNPLIKLVVPNQENLWSFDNSNQALNTVLEQVKTFLDQNPREVVTLFLDIYDNAQEAIVQSFEQTGIAHYLYEQNPAQAWPTFRTLIDNNTRLIVFVNETMQVGNLPDQYPWIKKFIVTKDYFFDTNYDFKSLQELEQDACQTFRGRYSSFNHAQRNNPPENKLFDLTHDVTPWLAGDPEIAYQANSYRSIKDHVDRCNKTLGIKKPNFITLDFYDVNPETKKVIDELNS